MADMFGAPSPDRKRQGEAALAQAKAGATGTTPVATPADSQGAAIYAAACASCHESGRPPPYGGVSLALSTTVNGPDPRNLANIVLAGVRPVEGERSPIMPGFAASMNDAQIAALVNYLRARFSSKPAWTDVESIVSEARRTQTALLQTSAGPANAPADPSQRDKP
jgi:mono/diheme cytochrome c family protein